MTPFFPLLLSAAVALPSQVPAYGSSESIVTLDRAGMVRIETLGPVGLGCELIDRVRGPFAHAGIAGRSQCKLELLLDAGTYKLRLEGPPNAKGTASVVVTEFVEPRPSVRLDEGQAADTSLAPGEQAGFWIHVAERRAVNLRVIGRTAGTVAMWRDGRWLENLEFDSLREPTRQGPPTYEWSLSRVIEPGDYKLVAYGVDPLPWPHGGESDALLVANGLEPGSSTRGASVVIPWTGAAFFGLPEGPTFAIASLEETPALPVSLKLQALEENGEVRRLGDDCRIEAKALAPGCSVKEASAGKKLLTVRSAPGTRVDLIWNRLAGNYGGLGALDGDFGLRETSSFTPLADGEHLIGLSEVPGDEDAAPLGCALHERVSGALVTTDLPLVDPKHPLARAFNSNGTRDEIWFHIDSSTTVKIQADPERHARCELYRMGPIDHDERLSDSPKDTACKLSQRLGEGDYRLLLEEGNTGIQTIQISAVAWFGLGESKSDKSPPKSGCLMRAKLSSKVEYLLTTNRGPRGAEMRGLLLRPLPDPLITATTLTLDPGRAVELPLLFDGTLEVRSVGGASYRCGLKSGVVKASAGSDCQLHARSPDALLLENPSAQPLVLTIAPRQPSQPKRAPPPFELAAAALPALSPDRPLYLDFERGQSHSMLFEVQDAGLYHVTTQGLLATECTLRTPVILAVANDSGSGRGRNCLVAQYLRPGHYLLTVSTAGNSRGRLSVLLSRHPPHAGPVLSGNSEAFFRAGDGELIQQRLEIKKSGSYRLETSARGVPLSCRLDDAQGWPLLPLPSTCAITPQLPRGEFLWTQLPPTVESLRHTTLEEIKPQVLWSGRKPRPITLHTWHDALLNKSGKDEWLLDLEAGLDVTFALTNRMQGRLYWINPDHSLKAIDVISPSGSSQTVHDEPMDDPGAGDQPESEDEEGEASQAPLEDFAPRAAPPLPGGTTMHLAAGHYKLIAEHSQGDVAVRYRLFVGSDVLTPGSDLDVPVPSKITVRMPRQGTLRIRTTGETDVRCRLRDAKGTLLAEVLDNGEDWNCAFAEPLLAGDYTLEIESEAHDTGATHVWVSLPAGEELGELRDAQMIQLGSGVASADVPRASSDSVQEISFSTASPFSCGLDDGTGALLGRQQNVTRCEFLLRPDKAYRVRLWVLDKPALLRATVETKAIESFAGGTLAQGFAARARLEKAGLWTTGPNIRCLADSQRGLFQDCSDHKSLEAGAYIFARARADDAGPLALEEKTFDDSEPLRERLEATRELAIQTSISTGRAIHLLAARSPADDLSSLSCSFAGGARVMTGQGCFAASPAEERASARWSSASKAPVEFELLRLAAPLSAPVNSVKPGRQHLTWIGHTGQFELPVSSLRLALILPAESWAVLLDSLGHPLDLCPPENTLARCELANESGRKLILWTATDPQAELTAIEGAPVPALPLANLYEVLSPAPGAQSFSIAADSHERILAIAGAERCALTLPDGLRMAGCRIAVPANREATLRLEVGNGPLRVVLSANPQEQLGFGPLPNTTGVELAAARAENISSSSIDRTLSLTSDAFVHLRAGSGVLALAQGESVLAISASGGRPAIDRFLTAGTYRFLLRPFGTQTTGIPGEAISWTQEPVPELTDGAGPQSWIAPGETRLFRFVTASSGNIGLGIRAIAETLDCAILDRDQRLVGTGCQQYSYLESGSYLLSVHAPASAAPQRFQPVLFGLAGAKRDVPPEFLNQFFERIGVAP